MRAVRPDMAAVQCDRWAAHGMQLLWPARAARNRMQPRGTLGRCPAGRSLADALLAVGFYYRPTVRESSAGDITPTITSREYVRLLSNATRMIIGTTPQCSDTYHPDVWDAAATSALVRGLRRQLRHRPVDATANRMLAIAELRAGNCKAALRHLGIAVNILLSPASRGCFGDGLHARLELALLLPLLIPLSLQLGRRAPTARRLVSTVLSRIVGG
jgi:hypothetical protein